MYRFILQWEKKDGTIEDIEFPLAPEKLTTKVGNKNKTVDLVKMGEVNIPKHIGLRDFSFKVLLPKDEALITGTKLKVNESGSIVSEENWTKMKYHEPIWYLSRLREIKANPNDKLYFVVIRELTGEYKEDGTAVVKRLFDGNLTVAIEDYTVEENAGEEGDWWVEIKLKELRQVGITKVIEPTGKTDDEGKEEAVEVEQREDNKAEESNEAKTYKVVSGDSLWTIAKKTLGDGSKWKEIWELNKDVISNPNVIKAGMELVIAKAKEGSNS